MRIVADLLHQVRNRRGIVRRDHGCERQRKRYRLAGLDQLGGGGALLVGDKVECAAFVVLAPPAPVAAFLKDALQFFFGEALCHR